MEQYRIGLMVGNKTIDYPHSIRMGVQNTLEDSRHLLVAIADLVPYHNRFNAKTYFQVAFEIAGSLDLDALIVPAGVISGYLSGDEDTMLRYLSILDPNKTVVLERDIPGYKCILKDNLPGMHDCMKHLLETCGYKNIAFISGPETSQGAREREGVYFEEMKAHGIEPAPGLFARGLFSGDCEDVIEKVIDDNPDLEAIACSCDLIAYTTYNILKKRKLIVGNDIAVTGFDDLAKSAHVDPPLSTVHMTGYDLGCMAAREAIRLCEGKEQKEKTLSSRFVIRNSCGEDEKAGVEYFKEILKMKPIPRERIIDILMDATILMTDKRTEDAFRKKMTVFFENVIRAYRKHASEGGKAVKLFSSYDINELFQDDINEHISKEGFQDVAVKMLEALTQISPEEDITWIIEQIAYLHMRMARLSSTAVNENTLEMNKREWNTFRMADDALREDYDLHIAHKSIMGEFSKLGVRHAELYLFSDSETALGTNTYTISDRIKPVGYMDNGQVVLEDDKDEVNVYGLVEHVAGRAKDMNICTVGGVMAGNELMGLAFLDSGTLDDNGQLMAFMNLGFALKHLQMISYEREVNDLLHKSNLRLTRQSMQDEMTGLLNRRGFMYAMEQLFGDIKNSRVALIYLDMDGLKKINDTYGHDEGDEAIKNMARILKESNSQGAIAGRMGGDEFITCFPVESEKDMEEYFNTIESAARDYNERNARPYKLSISYGGVCFTIDSNTPVQTRKLMTEADEQLYKMKRMKKGSRNYEEHNNC